MWGRLSLELGCPRFRQIHIHRVFPMSIVNTRTRRQIRTLPLDWNGGKWRCQQLGHPNMALASLPFGHGTGEPAFQQLIKDMSYDFPLKSDICASPSFGQSKMTCFISSTGQRTRMSKLSNQPGQIILSSKQPRINCFSDWSNYSQSGQHIWLLELDTYLYIYIWIYGLAFWQGRVSNWTQLL